MSNKSAKRLSSNAPRSTDFLKPRAIYGLKRRRKKKGKKIYSFKKKLIIVPSRFYFMFRGVDYYRN
jgi:hypothetical protein